MYIPKEIVCYTLKIKNEFFLIVISLIKGWCLVKTSNFCILQGNKKNHFLGKLSLIKTWAIYLVNVIAGLYKSYVYYIKLKGMGFKGIVIKKSNILMLKLGFSHRVVFLNTSDVKFYYKGKTQFTIESRDYLYLTNILFSFKMLKKINAYIKKGIYIKGELYTFKFSSKKSKF